MASPQKYYRDLHYARFLSGDGNFKLQRIAKKQSKQASQKVYRSMLSDGAYWAPVRTLADYVQRTAPVPDEPKGKVNVPILWSLLPF